MKTIQCAHCGREVVRRSNPKRPQRCCSLPCNWAWRNNQPKKPRSWTCRRLNADEPIPAGVPKRYRMSDGYIVLRWKVGLSSYVEVLEHRLIAGRDAPEVHHKNRIKDDNRPENLEPLSTNAHGEAHATWPVSEACNLYRSGWSIPRLAKKYGHDTSLIMRALKRRGVQMRTAAEAWAIRKMNHSAYDAHAFDIFPQTDRGADGPLTVEMRDA